MAPIHYSCPMTNTRSQDQDLRTYAEAFNDYYQGERPDVEPEDRDYVEYNDVEQVSSKERAYVEYMDALAAYDADEDDEDEPHDDGYYYSGTGEWSEDTSYEDYLNRH